MLITNISQIIDKTNKINYSLIISFTMILIPVIISLYVKFRELPSIPKPDGFFLRNIMTYSVNIIMWVFTICIIYLNLISINSIDYNDAIPSSKNFLNFFIGILVTVIGLYYIVPKIIGLFGRIFSFGVSAYKSENKLDTISLYSSFYSTFNASNFYDNFLEGLSSIQDKFKHNYVNTKANTPPTEDKSFFTRIFGPIIGFFNSIYNYISSSIIGSIYLFVNILTGFFENITKDISSEELQQTLIKYGALYSFIFIILGILYLAAFDTEALTGKAYVYAFTIIIPLVLLFSYVIPFNNQKSSLTKMLSFAFGIIVLIGIIYSYSSLDSNSFSYISYGINLLIVLILLFGLAIFFYIFGNYLKTLNNFMGFLVYFVFYIPCLIIDFFKYILNELKMTSAAIYVLFIIEIIFILLYVYSSQIINFFITKTSKSIALLEKSAFLDIKSNIGDSYKLRMTSPLNNDNEKYTYRKNYAISMWVYLNNQPPNNQSYSKETEIFNYGDGKPRITYLNDTTIDKGKDKYIFYLTNNNNNSYSLTLPSQKWNNIVFNYYSGKVDLFINGNLERTYTFNENMPIYLATDVITIGSKDGLDGAICNVNYYLEPLTKSQITIAYNLLMTKNPPTLVL
jgi:hypothetical protein